MRHYLGFISSILLVVIVVTIVVLLVVDKVKPSIKEVELENVTCYIYSSSISCLENKDATGI